VGTAYYRFMPRIVVNDGKMPVYIYIRVSHYCSHNTLKSRMLCSLLCTRKACKLFRFLFVCQMYVYQMVVFVFYVYVYQTFVMWWYSRVNTQHSLIHNTRTQTIMGEDAKKLKELCPMKVFDIEDGLATVVDSRRCTSCRLCVETFGSLLVCVHELLTVWRLLVVCWFVCTSCRLCVETFGSLLVCVCTSCRLCAWRLLVVCVLWCTSCRLCVETFGSLCFVVHELSAVRGGFW